MKIQNQEDLENSQFLKITKKDDRYIIQKSKIKYSGYAAFFSREMNRDFRYIRPLFFVSHEDDASNIVQIYIRVHPESKLDSYESEDREEIHAFFQELKKGKPSRRKSSQRKEIEYTKNYLKLILQALTEELEANHTKKTPKLKSQLLKKIKLQTTVSKSQIREEEIFQLLNDLVKQGKGISFDNAERRKLKQKGYKLKGYTIKNLKEINKNKEIVVPYTWNIEVKDEIKPLDGNIIITIKNSDSIFDFLKTIPNFDSQNLERKYNKMMQKSKKSSFGLEIPSDSESETENDDVRAALSSREY